ncbi:MAG: amidohydrolase family protein [Gemmatimonadota bacterium]|nr:amidohydrolase family protein [Gemmatimonadota bacterium]
MRGPPDFCHGLLSYRVRPVLRIPFLVTVGLLAPFLATPGELRAQDATPPTAPVEILHGFTLIDGLGGPPVTDGALAVRGATIVDAGPLDAVLSRLEDPGAALRLDLGGGYVVPGLIDAHVHLATQPDRAAAVSALERLLRSGITTVRDMAGDARLLAALAWEARTGRIQAPDIHHAALFAGRSFFHDPRSRAAAEGFPPGEAPWMQAVGPDTDLPLAVARARGTSARGLKIYADLDSGLVRNITAEAHRQGMVVWAHATVYPARPLDVVRAGVDVISHACPMAWEAMAEAPDRYHHDDRPGYARVSAGAPVFDELLGEMAARGTILDATLAMHTSVEGGPPEGEGPAPAEAPSVCDRRFARTLVRRAHELGVPIAAGTDFTADGDEGPALFLELEALVEHAGLDPMDAIAAATRVAAAAIGLEGRTGTLQRGAEATFVLLEADPTEDIGNLRTAREVWKNAVRYRVTGSR